MLTDGCNGIMSTEFVAQTSVLVAVLTSAEYTQVAWFGDRLALTAFQQSAVQISCRDAFADVYVTTKHAFTLMGHINR